MLITLNELIIYILEESWLFLFIISILFIFFIVIRDLGKQTRKVKFWRRSSYYKILPRVMLTFQHYSRRGELLSVTNYGMCKNIKRDMILYLQNKKGLTEEEVENLINDQHALEQMIPDKNVVLFLYDINLWLQIITPKKSFFQKLIHPIRKFFLDERELDKEFFIELAFMIRNFRKAME